MFWQMNQVSCAIDRNLVFLDRWDATIMSDHIAPNLRVVRILEVFAHVGAPMTPTELNDHVRWTKQTTHRLCQTMLAAGLLEKHGRRLQPHSRVNRLAAGLGQFAIATVNCHQILRDIASQIGETVNFVRPEKQGMTYVDRVETNWPFRILLPVGTHVPFHCTASGKTYLASLPAKRRKAMIASLDLTGLTPHTHVTKDSLTAEITQINKRGYALDLEEFHLDMVAIAVPVLDQKGRFFAALAVHGPIQRFDQSAAESNLELLQTAAKDISVALFDAAAD